MKKYTLLTFCIVFLFFITSCGQKFKQAEYASASGVANSEQETPISLEDGASISIPSDSVEGNVDVIIERNPQKVQSLPPLPEGVIQLSDFYNFEISGGKLVGPVDITMPINKDFIPEGDGILVAAFPSENGWEFKPVSANGNKVTIYTQQLGDPLIAWHFVDDNTLHLCDPTMVISVVPANGIASDEYHVVGRIKPIGKEFLGYLSDKLASLILGQEVSSIVGGKRIEIEINNDPSKVISAETNLDGTFDISVNPENDTELGFKEGVNWLKATSQCTDVMTGNLSSTSVGYTAFGIHPQKQVTETPLIAAEPPISQSEPIPPPQSHTDKIPVPNVVGMSFEDATQTLETLGFNTTWIDGTSTFEIGQVYSQSPKAGTQTVPHRTTVALYRTTEKRVLTPIERLIEFFKHAHYETTDCYKFDEFEATKNDCHLILDITNFNGQIREYYTFYYGENSNEQNYTITTSTTAPLSSIAGYWWIPNVGSPYEVEESFYLNEDVYSGSPAYRWNPGSIVEITIAGRSFSAQEYSTDYTWIYDDRHPGTAWKVALEFHEQAYYDTETGLLLKSEINSTYTECVNSYYHSDLYGPLCNATIGQTQREVFELSELEWTKP